MFIEIPDQPLFISIYLLFTWKCIIRPKYTIKIQPNLPNLMINNTMYRVPLYASSTLFGHSKYMNYYLGKGLTSYIDCPKSV